MSRNVRKFTADKEGRISEIFDVSFVYDQFKSYKFKESDVSLLDVQSIPTPPPIPNPWNPGMIQQMRKNLGEQSQPLTHEFSIHFRVVSSDFIGVGSRVEPKAPNKFEILLDERQATDMQLNPLAVMAHEIGHALAYLASLPYNKKSMFMNWHQQNPAEKYETEKEAWDVAEKLFKETRQKCLETYRPKPEPQFFIWPDYLGNKP